MKIKRIFQNVKHENPHIFNTQAGGTKITERLIEQIKSLNKNYKGWPQDN
jgi:hypothetical protein